MIAREANRFVFRPASGASFLKLYARRATFDFSLYLYASANSFVKITFVDFIDS